MTARVLWVLVACLALAGPAPAAPASARVLETWPPGESLTLPVRQSLYVRIAYQSEQPLRVWARPYFRGEEVDAASNPSPLHPAGSGEALGWFFFMEPGLEVDEVRITSGNGNGVLGSVPVRIVAGGGRPAAASEPAWVATLKAESEALSAAADRERASQPAGVADLLLSGLLMLLPLAVLSVLLAPAWGLWRWRGGWRLAAALPAGLMALVVLRILVDTIRDPTSHNLWPFEILGMGALCLGVMLVLALARRLSGASARGRQGEGG